MKNQAKSINCDFGLKTWAASEIRNSAKTHWKHYSSLGAAAYPAPGTCWDSCGVGMRCLGHLFSQHQDIQQCLLHCHSGRTNVQLVSPSSCACRVLPGSNGQSDNSSDSGHPHAHTLLFPLGPGRKYPSGLCSLENVLGSRVTWQVLRVGHCNYFSSSD